MLQDDENDAEKSRQRLQQPDGLGRAGHRWAPSPPIPASPFPLRPMNDRMFMLTPSASSTDVTEGKDNVFQMCFTDPNQGTAAAELHCGKRPGPEDRHHLQQRRRLLHRHLSGLRSRGREPGPGDGQPRRTFPATTTPTSPSSSPTLRSAGADLVFLPIYYTPASLILTQAKTMGYDADLLRRGRHGRHPGRGGL